MDPSRYTLIMHLLRPFFRLLTVVTIALRIYNSKLPDINYLDSGHGTSNVSAKTSYLCQGALPEHFERQKKE